MLYISQQEAQLIINALDHYSNVFTRKSTTTAMIEELIQRLKSI